MRCEVCNHDHQGQQWGFICIGCPCPARPGVYVDHDCRKFNDANRCTRCQLPIGVPCEPEPATPPPADEMRLAAGLADIAVLMEPGPERTGQEQRFVEWFAGWRK